MYRPFLEGMDPSSIIVLSETTSDISVDLFLSNKRQRKCIELFSLTQTSYFVEEKVEDTKWKIKIGKSKGRRNYAIM